MAASGQTREQVLEEFRRRSIEEAAMRLTGRKGVDDVTIQEIADEAGVAKGTIYVYFRDREELLARTADRLFEDLLEELDPAFDDPRPIDEHLRTLALRQIRFFDQHRTLFRATAALSSEAAQVPRSRSRCIARYVERLEMMFTAATKGGQLRAELDPVETAAMYRDLIRGVILRRRNVKPRREQASAEDAAERVCAVLLSGIQSSRAPEVG